MNEKELNYKETLKILKQENCILLDVRSKQEYEEGHLPGSKCISVYDLKKQVEKEIPNKQATIIVYCSSGGRSKQAQEMLEKLGYKKVYDLKGGLDNI